MHSVAARSEMFSHEQTSLSASTVTNNNQLATDFRHLRDVSMTVQWSVRPYVQYSVAMSGADDDRGVVVGCCMSLMEGSWAQQEQHRHGGTYRVAPAGVCLLRDQRCTSDVQIAGNEEALRSFGIL